MVTARNLISLTKHFDDQVKFSSLLLYQACLLPGALVIDLNATQWHEILEMAA